MWFPRGFVRFKPYGGCADLSTRIWAMVLVLQGARLSSSCRAVNSPTEYDVQIPVRLRQPLPAETAPTLLPRDCGIVASYREVWEADVEDSTFEILMGSWDDSTPWHLIEHFESTQHRRDVRRPIIPSTEVGLGGKASGLWLKVRGGPVSEQPQMAEQATTRT